MTHSDQSPSKLIGIRDAARRLGVSPSTLRRQEKGDFVEGFGLRVFRTPGGQRRYSLEEIEGFLKGHGFSGTLPVGRRPALIAIDFVRAFLDPASPMRCEIGPAELANARKLAEVFHGAGLPMVFARSLYDPEVAFSRLWALKIPSLRMLGTDSPWREGHAPLLDGLRWHQVDTVYPSVFESAQLIAFLQAQQVDTVVLCGVSTSGSIRASAVGALQCGYYPVVVADAVADRHAWIHRNNLLDISAKYANVERATAIKQYVEGLLLKEGSLRGTKPPSTTRGE